MPTRTAAARTSTRTPAKRPRATPVRASAPAPEKAAAAPKKTQAAAAPPAKKPAGKKPEKERVRLVRDSFTMPEADFALIATLKSRALAARRETKKSELLRAGLQVLAALDSKALVEVLGRLAAVKVGRPLKRPKDAA